MAAVSTFVKNNTMGTLSLTDGGAVSLSVPYDKGDTSITGLGPRLNDTSKHEARGRFISTGYSARRYPTISFSAHVSNLVGSTNVAPGSILEFCFGLGAYAANTPVQGTGRPYTCNIRLTFEGTAFGDAADEYIECQNVEWTADFSEAGEGNSITLTGTVLGNVVSFNGSNTVTYREIQTPVP